MTTGSLRLVLSPEEMETRVSGQPWTALRNDRLHPLNHCEDPSVFELVRFEDGLAWFKRGGKWINPPIPCPFRVGETVEWLEPFALAIGAGDVDFVRYPDESTLLVPEAGRADVRAWFQEPGKFRWREAREMPSWACRFSDEITAVSLARVDELFWAWQISLEPLPVADPVADPVAAGGLDAPKRESDQPCR